MKAHKTIYVVIVDYLGANEPVRNMFYSKKGAKEFAEMESNNIHPTNVYGPFKYVLEQKK